VKKSCHGFIAVAPFMRCGFARSRLDFLEHNTMITLTVVSYNNEAPSSRMSATFGKEGKTLGRSKSNYFVLDDPKNYVSRTQGVVKSDGVRHTITNLSRATPILVNGREIDTNCEYPLEEKDEIQIGLYLLRAEVASDAAAPLESETVLILDEPVHIQPPAADRIHPPPSTASAPDINHEMPADHQELVQAFLKGAGISTMTLPQGLTPEFMEMIGKLLAISVQGTMDLNALRALVKREAKADVTMVVVRNNNPLKFLPDGETVLMQMCRKKMPGFMSPVEAMEDIYEDLQAHQRAMVAGMRATMADLLKCLHPEALEKKLKQPSILESLLPANRKAKLWDQYTELNQDMNARAQDDFQMLFGRAFLRAYEQQVEQAKNDKNAGSHA
jgi:FHA domain-containing protein